VATPLVVQHQSQTRLREENEALRRQNAQLKQAAEAGSRSVAPTPASSQLSNDQFNELLRLRNEVGMLRNPQAAQPKSASLSTAEPVKTVAPDTLDMQAARELAAAVVQGDPTALDKLMAMAGAARQSLAANNAGLDETQRGDLVRQAFAPFRAAFEVINEAASKGNQNALQAVSLAMQTSELKSYAIQSFGVLAGNGDEVALDVLLNPNKYNLRILDSSVVGALKPAAAAGNQAAIDRLAAVSTDESKKPLWFMAADGLGTAAESGNPVAIDALIALSSSTNRSVRDAVVRGLNRAAAGQNLKAVEALRQMNTQ